MALTVKSAFSSGELDPALHERTTLDKFRNGLATGRNVVVTKIGSIASRQGRAYFKQCKLDDKAVVCYSPPGSGLVLEIGDGYVRVYTTSGVYVGEVVSLIGEADLQNIHFETSGQYVYFFISGREVQKFNYVGGFFVADFSVYLIPGSPVGISYTPAGAPTGYKVEYAVTQVNFGQESAVLLGTANMNVPIAAGQSNTLDVQVSVGLSPTTTEIKVYRRPYGAGAYGYIGSTSAFFASGGNTHASFVDLGQDADYTHSYPTLIADPISLLSNTGIVYQQRLLITDAVTDLEAIYASQPGFQNNFSRNYPLDSASALKFKNGTSGYARVFRMLDNDGLIAFTSAGIFLNQGELSPDNLSMAKKGEWVINSNIPPLAVPGGCLFVDVSTNAVRNLAFDWQSQKYSGPEVSIYSAHLFKTRQISTWNFQKGIFPLLWVVFNDGTFASFTFEFDEQMKAWTRHDSSSVVVRSSCGTINPDQTFFVVSKKVNGVTKRYIERTIPRYSSAADIATNPEYDKDESCAYMDSIVSWSALLNNSLLGTDTFKLSPTSTAQDWSLPLNLTCGTSKIFGNLNLISPIVGQVFRFFDETGSVYDLTVLSISDDNTIIVDPNTEFPSQYAEGFRLYQTKATFTGLDHMEGESVSVIVDRAVVCSPYNDDQNYPICIVTGGAITLPNGLLGAIVHVGRPIIGDVETLDIDTVEQSPTLIESLNVNKLYIKVHNSSGLYVANKYPVSGYVNGMQPIDSYDVDYAQENPIMGNRAQPDQTKRIEMTLPGDWKSNGKMAIRQVDPLHFEILSIIPDCEILKRSDR